MRLPIPSGLAFGLYWLLMNVLLPLILLLAAPLLLLKEKRRRTLLPRLGFQRYPEFAPGTPAPVWVHALSVGELLSVVPLIQRLRAELGGRPLVVSVSTYAARGLAESRLVGDSDGLVYFPFDLAYAYRRCFARIRPALFVLIETDIWPGYLTFFRQRGVPCLLLNGRLSPRSFRRLQHWWCLFGPALRTFARIFAQSPLEAERFAALGIERERLGVPGNLKFDACVARPTEEEILALRAELGYQPADRILLAGSTHRGEEEVLQRAFLKLREEFADLKLISVPRHPERGAEVRSLFASDTLRTALLTERTTPAPDVLVVNRLGYLNRLYSLATVAFVGGSLVPKGGQNPIEPAMAGKPVLFGPDMDDFPDVAPALVEGGGAFQIRGEEELIAKCRKLLQEPQLANDIGARARAVVESHAGITARLVAEIMERLRCASA
jgi:3-deoxy-D-manno-octulosonic-acid transferase